MCNYNCLHCPHSNYVKGELYKKTFLSEDFNRKLINEVKENEKYVKHIRYTAAGEPFLHPQIIEILDYAKKNCNTFISVTTNGSLLSDEMNLKLLNTKIDMVDISLDARYEETYKEIRRGGDFKSVKNSILNLLKQKKDMNSSLKIVVSFVKQELNANECDEFEKYWYSKGVDYVVIRPLHTAAGSMKKNTSSDFPINRRACVYPWERIVLSCEGMLDFCPASWEGKTHIVSYKDSTIKEIWNGKFYSDLRNEHTQNIYDKERACINCDDWEMTIWPNEDKKAYGDLVSIMKGNKESE